MARAGGSAVAGSIGHGVDRFRSRPASPAIPAGPAASRRLPERPRRRGGGIELPFDRRQPQPRRPRQGDPAAYPAQVLAGHRGARQPQALPVIAGRCARDSRGPPRPGRDSTATDRPGSRACSTAAASSGQRAAASSCAACGWARCHSATQASRQLSSARPVRTMRRGIGRRDGRRSAGRSRPSPGKPLRRTIGDTTWTSHPSWIRTYGPCRQPSPRIGWKSDQTSQMRGFTAG